MAVDNNESMVGVIAKKRFADPAQVEFALLVERNARPDARVNKQVITEPPAADEAFEKLHVVFGDCIPNSGQSVLVCKKCKLVGVKSVALEAFGTAETAPVADQLRVAFKDPKQDFLVVAEDKDGFNSLAMIRPQALDDVGGTGTPVDEIADKNEQCLLSRAMLKFSMDLGEQILEQVQTPMNVPDDIGTAFRRTCGIAAPATQESQHLVRDRVAPSSSRPRQTCRETGTSLKTRTWRLSARFVTHGKVPSSADVRSNRSRLSRDEAGRLAGARIRR